MSSSTASSVVADNQIVPGDHACSFDFVYCERRQQPHIELVADLGHRGLGDGGRDDEVGAQRQVRTVLFDGTERLDEDAAVRGALGEHSSAARSARCRDSQSGHERFDGVRVAVTCSR